MFRPHRWTWGGTSPDHYWIFVIFLYLIEIWSHVCAVRMRLWQPISEIELQVLVVNSSLHKNTGSLCSKNSVFWVPQYRRVLALGVCRGTHLGSIWTGTLRQRLRRERLNINIGYTCQASVTCRRDEHLLACIYSTLASLCSSTCIYLLPISCFLVNGVDVCILFNLPDIR